MIGTAVTPMPWIRTVVPIVALVTGVVSCAPRTASPTTYDLVLPHPEAPLGASGTRVTDASRAGLAFAPLELDRPKAKTEWVLLDHGKPDQTAAAFVYSTPAWGDVVVTELLTSQTQADLVSGLSPCDGCALPPDRVDLPGGVVAFVSTDAYHTGISWNVPARPSQYGGLASCLRLEMFATGPPERFSTDEAIGVATELSRPT
jgi:hypothetical protein